MDIHLHTDKCLSCGLCTSIAPQLFSLDSGVVALKKNPDVYTEKDQKLAKEAASSCPSETIEIIS